MGRDPIAATDHVYIFDVTENTSRNAREIVMGRTARSPGRGGNRDVKKWFSTVKVVVDHVDPPAAILDNF